jgi:hypothetical protein
VEQFKYLGKTLTNQNTIHEEIKSRLKPGNACCHSVPSLLSSSLMSKNMKIKICRRIILSVVLRGCETWSFTLREVHRLRMFENRVLRKLVWPKRDEVTGEWKNYITMCSVPFTKYHSGDQIEKNQIGRACSTYGRHESCIHVIGGQT